MSICPHDECPPYGCMKRTTHICTVCGAHMDSNYQHRHEDPVWKPAFDDLEGSLDGYVCVELKKRAQLIL